MFVRIVKMSFQDEHIHAFLDIFGSSKEKIRNFKGCQFLELYRDKTVPNVFFTYSYWESEDHLASYRNSELFKAVWSQTKILFSDRPEAWSVDKVETLL